MTEASLSCFFSRQSPLFACGLALSRGSFLFVALFGAVWAAIIIAIRLR
jgi:hypothetical protein